MDTVTTHITSRPPAAQRSVAALHEIATQLRIDSVQATTAAGSSHPTSCASAAEIMAVLFFDIMRSSCRRTHVAAW